MSFKSVQDKIAKKEGVSKEAAAAILAKSSRDASPAAKKANPALKKVAMPKAKEGGRESAQDYHSHNKLNGK
jgi:hypothetical protein